MNNFDLKKYLVEKIKLIQLKKIKPQLQEMASSSTRCGGSGRPLVVHSPRVDPLCRINPGRFMVGPDERVLSIISSSPYTMGVPTAAGTPMAIHGSTRRAGHA